MLFNSFLICPFTDIKLRFCDVSPAGSCCNAVIEQKMAFHSRQAIDRNTRDAISKMSSTLQTRAQRFNGKSDNLFSKSQEINFI